MIGNGHLIAGRDCLFDHPGSGPGNNKPVQHLGYTFEVCNVGGAEPEIESDADYTFVGMINGKMHAEKEGVCKRALELYQQAVLSCVKIGRMAEQIQRVLESGSTKLPHTLRTIDRVKAPLDTLINDLCAVMRQLETMTRSLPPKQRTPLYPLARPWLPSWRSVNAKS